MQQNAKKEIKSPFSQGNSQTKSYNEDYNKNTQLKNESLTEDKLSKYNTSSAFIKTTYSTIPKSSYLKKQIKSIPFVLNISPFSNYEEQSSVPLIDYGESYDLPRCQNQKCGAFLNPFVEFINGNSQWKCNICKNINKVLDYYNSFEEGNIKNELNSGTYEFMAYKSYWNKERPPIFACYYFLIDISQISINSGFTQCVLESIKDCLNNDSFDNYENVNIKICIITYDEQINFYPVDINNENNHNINMLSINESYNNLFLPTNKDFLLIDIKKYKNKLIQIIENIQTYISSENCNTSKEANRFFDAVKICDLIGEKKGGKILIFSGTNLSKLKFMNNPKDEDTLDDYNIKKYKITDGGQIGKLGISISLHGLSVNIFQSCKTHTNIKTLNQLIINSNGNLFFYRNFSAELHYKNIYNQIRKILQNKNVFESGLKLRFSHKFGVKDYITPVLLYNKEMVFFPNLDSDQNYSFILEMNYQNNYESSENYIINDDFTYLQAALFYNRGDGNKILRVYNLRFPVSSNAKDIYDSINPEIFGAMTCQKLIMDMHRSKKLVENVNKLEKNFYDFFNGYFNNLNIFKKELSEEMKIYSLYVLGIFKNCLFNKNDKGINNDDDLTNFFLSKMQKIKIEEILCFIYPRIYSLDNLLNLDQDYNYEIPPIINDNIEALINSGNIFLIDNGFYLILYLRNEINKNIIVDLFDVNDINEINFETINEGNIFDYNDKKSQLKNRIIEIIDNIRNIKSVFQNLKIIFEGINDEKGKIINNNLIEDNYCKDFPFSFQKFLDKIIFE